SNVSLLKDTLERLPRSKKIVIIGHSKGALESLIFALENKFFVRDHVEAMFLIQGPFLGSPIADYLVGRGRAVDERIPFFSRIFLHSAYYVLGTALSSEALHSMTSHSIFNFWDARKTEIEASPQDITEPIFFIRTHQDYRKMSFFIDESGRYLDTYYGSNDGLVMLEDQSLPSVGQTIATLDDTDHADLMLPSPLSSKDKNYRIAFTHTLLWWLSSSSKKY
ncbi:MAG: hypothetical protein KA436_12115, partial [Oligoflexales bacterium]|nr:hypothetical protein [Oligoflexales bacterium]